MTKETILLMVALASMTYVVITSIGFALRVNRNKLPINRGEVKRVAIQIGLGSVITGLSGGIYASLVNSPPNSSLLDESRQIDWMFVLSCTACWPMLILATFLFSLFTSNRYKQ